MITHEEIVNTIKEVLPELKDVPVYFNEPEADYIGSAYFGLGKHGYDIMPEEEIDNPMFEVADFVEQKHLGFYHVGLRSNLLSKKPAIEEYFVHVWNTQNFNFPLNNLTKELFIILHEFGHAHELYVQHNQNVETYISTRENYSFGKHNSDTLENVLKYKELEIEQYADAIVYENIYKVFKKLIGIED